MNSTKNQTTLPSIGPFQPAHKQPRSVCKKSTILPPQPRHALRRACRPGFQKYTPAVWPVGSEAGQDQPALWPRHGIVHPPPLPPPPPKQCCLLVKSSLGNFKKKYNKRTKENQPGKEGPRVQEELRLDFIPSPPVVHACATRSLSVHGRVAEQRRPKVEPWRWQHIGVT